MKEVINNLYGIWQDGILNHVERIGTDTEEQELQNAIERFGIFNNLSNDEKDFLTCEIISRVEDMYSKAAFERGFQLGFDIAVERLNKNG